MAKANWWETATSQNSGVPQSGIQKPAPQTAPVIPEQAKQTTEALMKHLSDFFSVKPKPADTSSPTSKIGYQPSFGGQNVSVPDTGIKPVVQPAPKPTLPVAQKQPITPTAKVETPAPKTETKTAQPTETKPAAKPTSFTAPEVPKQVVPIDYNANKYYLRPGESIPDFEKRTGIAGFMAGTEEKPSDGTLSVSEQQKLNQSISKTDPSDPSSVMSSAMDFFGGGTAIDQQVQGLLKSLLSPNNSFTDQYNQLLAQSGLSEDQSQLVKLQNIMTGTEDDIRKEISNAGGFASESQIQNMVYQRNKNLEKQYSDLSNIANLKQNMVSTQIGLIEKDQSYKETMFNTLAKLEEFGITKQTQFQNNTFNRLKWMASTGGLENITPEEAMLYSVGTGGQISAQEIMSSAKNTTAKTALNLQIENLRLQNTALKGITGQSFGTRLDQEVKKAMTGFYGTSGARETLINVLQSEFPNQDPATIQKSVMNQLPDGWESKITGKTAAHLSSQETQNILSDIAGNASLPALVAAYPDVSPAVLQSMFTANLTYGTAGTGQ